MRGYSEVTNSKVINQRLTKRLELRYPDTIDEQEASPQQNMTPPPPLVLSIDPLKFIEQLPDFDGKSEELFTFVELVEDIIPLLLKYDTSSQNVLLNRIKSKLRGKAREMIEINNHVRTWSEIKLVLTNSFGDKKTNFQIFDELRAVTFNTNSADLYNQIKSILRRLNNKSKDQPNADFNIKANNLTALNIFKDKLPEPMRSILFSRNPQTLEESLDILFEGNYGYYNPSKNSAYKYRNSCSAEQNNVHRPRGRDPPFNDNRRSMPNNNNNQTNFNPRPFQSNRVPNQSFNNPNFVQSTRTYNQPNFNPRPFQSNRSRNFRQNQQFNSYPNNNRVEPMDVDRSINSRINALEEENVIENFPLEASETTNHSLI